MDNSLIVEGLNIAELSDEDLAAKLQELGFNAGPILDTTRSVYQRKLARLLRNEDFDQSDEMTNNEFVHTDEEVRPTPILNSTLLDYSSSSSSFSVDDLRRRPLSRYEGTSFQQSSPVLSAQKPWSVNDIVSQVEPPPGELEKPLVPTSYKIIALCSLVLFIFIIYYNMESTPANPFTT